MRRPALVLLGFLMSFGVTAAKAQTPGTASKPATGSPRLKRGSEAYSPSALL